MNRSKRFSAIDLSDTAKDEAQWYSGNKPRRRTKSTVRCDRLSGAVKSKYKRELYGSYRFRNLHSNKISTSIVFLGLMFSVAWMLQTVVLDLRFLRFLLF